MITVVIVLNILISLICLYVTWRVWLLRRTFRAIGRIFAASELYTYAALHKTPEVIATGQDGVNQLRQRYQNLELQLQQIRTVLKIVSWVFRVWRSRVRRWRYLKRYRRQRY